MAEVTSTKDPFEGIFLPTWKVGDQWRATMKTEVEMSLMLPSGPTFGNVDFAFRVLAVPVSDDGVFRVEIENKPKRMHYVGQYRKRPFSFVRLEDEHGKSISMTDETNPAIPYVGAPCGRFVKVFPAMPGIPRLGITTFMFEGAPATQDSERTAEGLRFTIKTTSPFKVPHGGIIPVSRSNCAVTIKEQHSAAGRVLL